MVGFISFTFISDFDGIGHLKAEKITDENPFHLLAAAEAAAAAAVAYMELDSFHCLCRSKIVQKLDMRLPHVRCPESLIRRCLCIEYTK